MEIESKRALCYFCLRCNRIHYELEPLYITHSFYRDKKGIQMRTIEKRVKKKQTSLLDYNFFSSILNNFKLGVKKK